MTDADWDRIVIEAVEIWGRSTDTERRLNFWHRRWGVVPYERMHLALTMLERQCDAWPGPAKMHAVLEQLASSADARTARAPAPDPPLTAAEWRELSELLGREADARQSRNLTTLALFYAENAERLERGDEPLWPPPKWQGQVLGSVFDINANKRVVHLGQLKVPQRGGGPHAA